MNDLVKQQKLTAYMQIDSIWKKIHRTPTWAKVVILMLFLDVGLHFIDKVYYQNKDQKDLVLKWAYKAGLLASKGDIDQMNRYINKAVSHDLYKSDKDFRELVKTRAGKCGPQLLVDGFLARDILIENPEGHKALDRWAELQTADPEAAEKFAESQNDEDKNKHASVGD